VFIFHLKWFGVFVYYFLINFFFFRQGLTLQPTLASNSQSSPYLSLLIAEMTGSATTTSRTIFKNLEDLGHFFLVI
jgi:hypothetical protein